MEKMIYLRLISAYENFNEHFQPQSQRVIIIRSRNEVNEIFFMLLENVHISMFILSYH